ncbi:hypothetical protein H2203_006600 [Taxawa tesnikishii (nom. ined.)]|nr:hypothetical protein H2203_006600 [Dothideales sp. JES 119]
MAIQQAQQAQYQQAAPSGPRRRGGVMMIVEETVEESIGPPHWSPATVEAFREWRRHGYRADAHLEEGDVDGALIETEVALQALRGIQGPDRNHPRVQLRIQRTERRMQGIEHTRDEERQGSGGALRRGGVDDSDDEEDHYLAARRDLANLHRRFEPF